MVFDLFRYSEKSLLKRMPLFAHRNVYRSKFILSKRYSFVQDSENRPSGRFSPSSSYHFWVLTESKLWKHLLWCRNQQFSYFWKIQICAFSKTLTKGPTTVTVILRRFWEGVQSFLLVKKKIVLKSSTKSATAILSSFLESTQFSLLVSKN
jgi:hypothetical protein